MKKLKIAIVLEPGIVIKKIDLLDIVVITPGLKDIVVKLPAQE